MAAVRENAAGNRIEATGLLGEIVAHMVADLIELNTANGIGGVTQTTAPHGKRGFVGGPQDSTPQQIGSEGANFGFADGSVQWLRQDELQPFFATLAASSKIRAYLPVIR